MRPSLATMILAWGLMLLLHPGGLQLVSGDQWWGQLYEDVCILPGYFRYYSRLWDINGDWQSTCESTPTTIEGVYFTQPTLCINHGIGGIWGEFHVPRKACNPNWGEFKDDGCIAGGFNQYSAVLYDVPSWSTWEYWCANSPAIVEGQLFPAPSSCVKDIFHIYGRFHVKDLCCSGHQELTSANDFNFTKTATPGPHGLNSTKTAAVRGHGKIQRGNSTKSLTPLRNSTQQESTDSKAMAPFNGAPTMRILAGSRDHLCLGMSPPMWDMVRRLVNHQNANRVALSIVQFALYLTSSDTDGPWQARIVLLPAASTLVGPILYYAFMRDNRLNIWPEAELRHIRTPRPDLDVPITAISVSTVSVSRLQNGVFPSDSVQSIPDTTRAQIIVTRRLTGGSYFIVYTRETHTLHVGHVVPLVHPRASDDEHLRVGSNVYNSIVRGGIGRPFSLGQNYDRSDMLSIGPNTFTGYSPFQGNYRPTESATVLILVGTDGLFYIVVQYIHEEEVLYRSLTIMGNL